MDVNRQEPSNETSMSDDEYRQALRHFAGVDQEPFVARQEPEEQLSDADLTQK